MSHEDRLAQAVELVKAGKRAEAQRILAHIILADKDNVRAWMLMARITDDPKRALQCWQQVARLKPDDLRVMREMARVRGEPLSQVPTRSSLPAVPSFEPATPAKKANPLRWLLGGAAALVVIVSGVALTLAASNTNQQAMATDGTGTATVQQGLPTDTLLPTTAVAATVLTSATATSEGLNLLTVAPSRATTTLLATSKATATAKGTTASKTATPQPTATRTPTPTLTPTPTNTPRPADTAIPPTATPPGMVRPGTYLVGPGINPGVYRGQAASGTTCYWARLDDQSQTLAERNSIGQFYLEVRSTDYALDTRCDLIPLGSVSPNPGGSPTTIPAGMYLIGRDIPAGTYSGQAQGSGCYWELLSDVAGELDSIIVNGFITSGPFTVDVATTDYALLTECPLQR